MSNDLVRTKKKFVKPLLICGEIQNFQLVYLQVENTFLINTLLGAP